MSFTFNFRKGQLSFCQRFIKIFFIGKAIALLLFFFLFVSINFGCRRNSNKEPAIENKATAKSIVQPITKDLLLFIPPLINTTPNNDSSTSLIISTADVARFDNKKEEKPYTNSVQIVDADAPWPPRWYVATPYYTDEMFKDITAQHQYRFDFVIDPKVESGFFSFYKILSQQEIGVGQLVAPDFAGYILLNEKFEPVDTVRSKVVGFNMYFHDLRINDNAERMVDMKKNIRLDLRKYTNNEKDSAVNCNVDYIQILDTNNNLIFSWDPLKNLDPRLFRFSEVLKGRAFATRHADIVEWTRLTSALWDYDGNILYAMKEIGIGKVSRKDGHIIWQINYSDIPIISGKDTIEWYHPHDFNMLSQTKTTVTYSLFSNGNETKPACGVIFEMDKKTQKIKLVKYIHLKTNYKSDGQGNIDYSLSGNYAIGYGFFEKSDTIYNYRNALEYQKGNGKYGIYQLPQWIYCYKARLLENWPRPPRPSIIKEGDSLKVIGEMKDWTWYKLSGPGSRNIEKAGKGNTIKAEKGVSYCVEGQYGFGFSVSRIFIY